MNDLLDRDKPFTLMTRPSCIASNTRLGQDADQSVPAWRMEQGEISLTDCQGFSVFTMYWFRTYLLLSWYRMSE